MGGQILHRLPPVVMNFQFARQHLIQALSQPPIDLAAAALYIAQSEYPDLEVEEYLNGLETMAAEVSDRLPLERYPLKVIQTLNHYLYKDLGFVGNTSDYYDPRNSFLNEVIDRRTGIPITLSLIYLELARRIDFPMEGVGFPGHFLIRPVSEEMEIHVDPFHQGEILFFQDCQERLVQIYGPEAELRPAYFQAVTSQQFLVRLLTNLKHIYLNRNQLQQCLKMTDMILLVVPQAISELRDRGILYYQLDRWPEACQDLQTYLDRNPAAEDIPFIHQLLRRMGKRV